MTQPDPSTNPESTPETYPGRNADEMHRYLCDRCGQDMHEKNCKVICPNCGNRFDCSDLNIYFD
jgi:hypothetical protein